MALWTAFISVSLKKRFFNSLLEALGLTRGRVLVHHGKGGLDRVVYISPDTHRALVEYLQLRPRAKAKQVFLVGKGPYT